jgi:hypothetical protein
MRELRVLAFAILLLVSIGAVGTCTRHARRAEEAYKAADSAQSALSLAEEGLEVARVEHQHLLDELATKVDPTIVTKIRKAKARVGAVLTAQSEVVRVEVPVFTRDCDIRLSEDSVSNGTPLEPADPWVDVSNKASVILAVTDGGDLAASTDIETTLLWEGGTFETITTPIKDATLTVSEDVRARLAQGHLYKREHRRKLWWRTAAFAAAGLAVYEAAR